MFTKLNYRCIKKARYLIQFTMIVLSLDPASCTGWCVVELDFSWYWDKNREWKWSWDTANIYEYGYINVDLSSEYQGDHCIDLMNKIKQIIDAHGVEHITIEDYFFSKRFANGSTVNASFRTAIHILARQMNITYTILNISAWKTYIAGRSSPTKQQKIKWGKTASNKIYIQHALWERFSIRFPNHSISEKTGKPICFKYDVVDVVAQAIYYCCVFCHVPTQNIYSSVEIPDDVEINNKKAVYVYQDQN